MSTPGWSLVRRGALYGGLLVTGVGCETPVVEEPFVPLAERSGTFVLSTFRDEPVPFGYGTSTPFSGGTLLMADTVRLSADGSARRTFVLLRYPGNRACPQGPLINCASTLIPSDSSTGSWGVRGYMVKWRDPLEPATTIEARFSLQGDTLIVARTGNGAVGPGDWRYVRR